MTNEPIALTVEEAAETLRLGRCAVLDLLRRDTNPIPSFRYGRRVVIPRRELVEWAANETRGANHT
jgi:excisionase family DNA binding protein